MTLNERSSLEMRIDSALEDMLDAEYKRDDELMFMSWLRAIFYASILRTEINVKGFEYIGQKRENIRKAMGAMEETKQKIYLYLQEILLAKQNRDWISFEYWYGMLRNVLLYGPVIKPRIFEEI